MVLAERLESLGRLDDVTGDERDRRRPGEQVLETLDARIASGDLGQGVLDDGVVGVAPQRGAQLAQLGDGQSAVLG